MLYKQLFGKSERRMELLGASADFFFQVVLHTFLADVEIGLSKLTDPATQRNFDNLSLEMLQSRLEKAGDPALITKARAVLDKLHTECKPFRTLRHKLLAHHDLQTALATAPVPAVSRQMVNTALALVSTYMNLIDGHYGEMETAYEHFHSPSDADTLVHVLKAGLRYNGLIQNGTISWDDFLKSEWYDA